jgi:hypothetical protein
LNENKPVVNFAMIPPDFQGATAPCFLFNIPCRNYFADWFLWVFFGMFGRIHGQTYQKTPIKLPPAK